MDSNFELTRYWDIHDFLSEEEKILVRFQCDSYQNSDLDLNQTSEQLEDIQQGAKIEIPLWLSIKLCQAQFLQIEIPTIYRENFKKTLIADPTVVNLRQKNYYYYEFGTKVSNYIDDQTIGPILIDIYLERVKHFSKLSYHLKIEKCSQIMNKMSHLEIKLFNKGRYASHLYKNYKTVLKQKLYEHQQLKLKSLKNNN